MCATYGYDHHITWSQLAHLAGLGFDAGSINFPEAEQFYPAQSAPVIFLNEGQKLITRMHWGLVPDFWRKPLEEKRFSTFNYNSRAADWLQKPTFRDAVRHRRCIIPATYFCEYTGAKGKKHLVPFSRPDAQVFAMAGVWSFWQGISKGEAVKMHTFSMLTTAANEIVKPIHPKAMPVILEWDDVDIWLSAPMAEAARLAVPCPTNRLQVSTLGRAS
jgi:putative SOS response-associated peptidase YedK